MTQTYASSQNYVNTDFSDLLNVTFSPSAKIDFSIDSGSQFRQIGLDGKGSCVTTKGLLPTTYSLEYFDLKPADVLLWRQMATALEGSNFAIPFNDVSDNVVFSVERDGISQRGVFFKLCGSNTRYRAYKVYSAGKKSTFYPIYYFEPNSSILINDQDIGLLDVGLDRTTGVFNSSLPLENYSFETDLYYKLVKIQEPIQFRHLRGSGIMGVGINSDITLIEEMQLFNVSLLLKEVFLAESFNTPVCLKTSNTPNLSKLNLDSHQNDLVVAEQYHSRSVSISGVDFNQTSTLLNKSVTKLIVPGRESILKDLTYWLTLFKATSGGSFKVDA
jgi:hypothetical protein